MINIFLMDKAIFYLLICYAVLSCITIAGTSIILALAFVLAVIRYIKQPIKPVLNRSLIAAIAVFFCTALLSALTAYEPITSLKQLWKYFYRMVPFFLSVFFVRTRQQLTVIMLALGVSIFIADSYAIWQGIRGQSRATAFGANAMILAGYLVQMIPLLLVMIADKECLGKRTRSPLALIFLLSLIALIYNGTRGAWVAVAFAFVVYGIMSINHNKYILPSVLILFIAAGTVFGMTPALQQRAQSIVDINDRSNSERIALWKSGWNMFREHPLTGIGLGNFEKLYQEKYILPEAKNRNLSHAHNNFVHIAAETGILGLAGFIYMFGYIVCFSWRQYRLSPSNAWAIGCFLVTISLLTQGLTEFNFRNSAVMRLYWLIVGLMLVSGTLYTDKYRKKFR